MTYTDTEARYFYWHCTTAALLIEKLEINTATRAHIGRAIRMATLTAIGKAGVHYASKSAYEQKGASQSDWSRLGLIQEHVVPISVIANRVMEAYDSRVEYSWRELVPGLSQDDLQNWSVIDSDYLLDEKALFSATIATIVRRSTVLAWITEDENRQLRKNGLTKTMPANHGDDALARYKVCAIELVPIGAAIAA